MPIGKEDFHMFNQGDLLDPIRLPKKFLELRRAKMGEPNFLAQYQQRLVLDGGGEIDISLFRKYDALPKPYDARFLSIDAASFQQLMGHPGKMQRFVIA